METFSFVSLSYEYLMNIDGNTVCASIRRWEEEAAKRQEN